MLYSHGVQSFIYCSIIYNNHSVLTSECFWAVAQAITSSLLLLWVHELDFLGLLGLDSAYRLAIQGQEHVFDPIVFAFEIIQVALTFQDDLWEEQFGLVLIRRCT